MTTIKRITQAQYRTRYFEDLKVGESYESHPITLSTDEMLRFSAEYDRQYFHTDAVAAKDSPFGGLIASGAHTFAVWNRLNLEMNGDVAWIAGVGFDEFRFPSPLRPELEFRAVSELLTKRESASDRTRGVVVHHHQLVTSEGTVVFTCKNPALVHRR